MNFLLNISPHLKYNKCYVLVYEIKETSVFSLFRVEQTKGEVDTEIILENASDINLLENNKLKTKGQPFILALFGEGIVQRTCKGSVDELHTVIPNINIDDYFICSSEAGDDNRLVALLKLQALQSIVNELNELNILIWDVTLGFVDIVRHRKILSIERSHFYVGNQYLKIEENTVKTGKRTTSEENNLNETSPDSTRQNIAMGGAVSFFLNISNSTGTQPSILLENKKELTAAKISSVLTKYFLPALMILLLINFVLFDRIQGANNELSGVLANNSKIKHQIESLKSQISDEEEFYKQTNQHRNRKYAFYIDRISSLAPSGIKFEKLTVNPILKKIRKNEMISYKRREIEVSGLANNADCFSQFLMNVDTTSIDLKITKQAYNYDSEKGKAKFEIVIQFPEK